MYASAYSLPCCLPLLLRPSLAPSPSAFESLYMRALTPTHVPAGFRQSGSRPGQPAWPITGLTTRVFCSPLLLSTPRVIEYSDDVVLLFHPPHISHHLPAPLPDNSIMIVIVVSVWIVVFMLSEASPSQMSLNSSQTGQQQSVQYCFHNGNGKELVLWCMCAFSFGFFLLYFLTNIVAFGNGL